MSPFEHTQRSRLGDSANKAGDMNTPFPGQAAIDTPRRAAREVSMASAPVSIHSHANCAGIAIQVHLQGCPPMRLQMPQPDYWFVMFNKTRIRPARASTATKR